MDSNSDAYISISYTSVEYRKLLKKVSKAKIIITVCHVVHLGEVYCQPTHSDDLIQTQSHDKELAALSRTHL